MITFFRYLLLIAGRRVAGGIQNFELAENYFELNKQQNLKRENLFYRICVCKKISYKYETVAASVDVTKHSQTSSLDFRKKVELCSVVKP